MNASLLSNRTLPLVIESSDERGDMAAWIAKNRDYVNQTLATNGGILFRGSGVTTVQGFQHFIDSMADGLLEYSYRSTPRTQINGRIYTSTEYPADQSIPLHNEMAYTTNWPMKIWFGCLTAPEQGGETPICNSRRVFERIDPEIRDAFASKSVMYVRNYYEEIGLPWQDVFNTSDRAEVETICRSSGIAFEWLAGTRLRTRQVCQAVARHPRTGEMVWFNQAHLFHVSSLGQDVMDALVSMYDEADLPRTAAYGDGSPIELSALDEIRRIYNEEAVTFPWKESDVLLLDNMLTAHGRMPFGGARKIVVGMAEAVGDMS